MFSKSKNPVPFDSDGLIWNRFLFPLKVWQKDEYTLVILVQSEKDITSDQ